VVDGRGSTWPSRTSAHPPPPAKRVEVPAHRWLREESLPITGGITINEKKSDKAARPVPGRAVGR
jgi:hypothetical protein